MLFACGDTHGDVRRFNTEIFPEQKEMTRDDFVLILGDFGLIWSDSKEENHWLDWLNNKSFTTLFIDGNHDSFDLLEQYPVVDFHGGKAHKIRENIYHLMRGYVFEFDGKKFFAFGGASSHDIQDGILDPDNYEDKNRFKEVYHMWQRQGKMFRVKGVSWWEQELPTEEEMQRGKESLKAVGNKVDFVISHCPPQEVASVMGYHDPDILTMYFNGLLHDGLEFNTWLFGHLHENKRVMGKFICLYEQIVRIT